MKVTRPSLQIRIQGIDGSIATFTQKDPDLVNHTLAELDPVQILTQTRITIAGNHSVTTLVPPLITRIDVITDRLSVWDFPFAIGALMELTETEFREHVRDPQPREQPCQPVNSPVFIDIEMVGGQRSFLRMAIIAGPPSNRLLRIHSLLKERSLIFGLHTGGIGVLNLANMVRFSVYPDSLEEPADAWSSHPENGHQLESHTETLNTMRMGNSSRHLPRKGNRMAWNPSKQTNIQAKPNHKESPHECRP